MHVIEGEAVTADALRIIKRLCNHWGHKLVVRMEGSDGVIEFPDAQVTLQALPDRLAARIESATPAPPRRLTGVVATHLQRMAGDAGFEVRWAEPVERA